MASLRVTQKDLARRLGITQAAVSLALSNHPSISAEVRERVRRLAAEVGYIPDPYLSGLSVYRKKIRPAQFQATLGWITNHPTPHGWKQFRIFQGYYDGAQAKAAELGYKIETHWIRSPSMTVERLEKTLQARGINGLLFAPQSTPDTRITFNFERFSAVTFGYTLVQPRLHCAALHQFRSMHYAVQRLLKIGYRRPGLAIADDSDLRADHNWSSAFWSEQQLLPKRERVPLLLGKPLNQDIFMRWFQKYRPDVVLTIWPEVKDWIVEAGVLIPEDVGLAMLSVPDESGNIAGIWENPHLTGAKAAEFLIGMIHCGERGAPESPLYLLTEGKWIDGRTLRSPLSAGPDLVQIPRKVAACPDLPLS